MGIVFNVGAARFRDTATGKFVTRAVLKTYLDESVASSVSAVGKLTDAYSSKSLSAADFFTAFKAEIKGEYIRQYIAGRGGLPSMTQSDWGRLGQLIKTQYAYAAGFQADIAGLSEAQISARAAMYSQSAGAAFEYGQLAAVKSSGKFTKEYWQLGDAEHCPDCESLNSQGWVEIGTLGTVPRAGGTECLTNCKCEILYAA